MASGKELFTRVAARIVVRLSHAHPLTSLTIAFLSEPATVDVPTFNISPISL
jgi:hypothetical protein